MALRVLPVFIDRFGIDAAARHMVAVAEHRVGQQQFQIDQ